MTNLMTNDYNSFGNSSVLFNKQLLFHRTHECDRKYSLLNVLFLNL